jgi:D-serine deaminase-like pyridoxal phosphate-dependent protein
MKTPAYDLPPELSDRLETPAVLVDRRILQVNIDRMQARARDAGLKLRPHVKTHKSIAIARQQMAAGACGLTAAKVGEALVFIAAGIPSVTLAYPLITPAGIDRILAAAGRHGCTLRLIVDSAAGLDLLEARVSAGQGPPPGVFIKIDVGLHRCGLPPDDPLVITLARRIVNCPRLVWRGLLSHAGQVYAATDGQEAARIAEDERRLLLGVVARLEAVGIDVPERSVGATPTVLAAKRFAGLTEIRPGNYVFMDQTPLRLGLIDASQIALSVLATVVSTGPRYAIVDAGSKTLSSDRGAHGTAGISGYGVAFGVQNHAPLAVAKLSEEHGFVELSGQTLRPGDRLRIYPNHACPVVNLAREICFIEDGRLTATAVDAAGCVR